MPFLGYFAISHMPHICSESEPIYALAAAINVDHVLV